MLFVIGDEHFAVTIFTQPTNNNNTIHGTNVKQTCNYKHTHPRSYTRLHIHTQSESLRWTKSEDTTRRRNWTQHDHLANGFINTAWRPSEAVPNAKRLYVCSCVWVCALTIYILHGDTTPRAPDADGVLYVRWMCVFVGIYDEYGSVSLSCATTGREWFNGRVCSHTTNKPVTLCTTNIALPLHFTHTHINTNKCEQSHTTSQTKRWQRCTTRRQMRPRRNTERDDNDNATPLTTTQRQRRTPRRPFLSSLWIENPRSLSLSLYYSLVHFDRLCSGLTCKVN